MIIAGSYSFNNGLNTLEQEYPKLLTEIRDIIAEVDSTSCKTKKSREKTMPGRLLYNPKQLNAIFEKLFMAKGWEKKKVV